MSVRFVLLPLFVEIVLTFVLLFATAFTRRRDLMSGTVHPRDIALGQLAWTPKTQQLGNAFNNQFQLPILFYVLTILSIVTRHTDLLFVILAWLFVLSRLAHAYVHVTNNRVMRRGGIFGIGAVVLLVMWVIFMVRILAGLP
jgi:hypothetical protein